MEVIQICGWPEFFIICIFFLMAAQIFNSATDWLFTTVPWWLTVPLASQNWLSLTLAGNQDTILFLALCLVLHNIENIVFFYNITQFCQISIQY